MIKKMEVKTISGVSGASFGTDGNFQIKADSGTLQEVNNLISAAPEMLTELENILPIIIRKGGFEGHAEHIKELIKKAKGE